MTNKPPSEIQTLIEDHINGFNTRTQSFSSVFLGTPRSSLMASHPIAG